jgi:hypothetical protein
LGYIRPLFDTAAAIAATRHTRITRAQLLAAGVDDDRIKRWVRDGRLYRVHRGVYAIGRPAPSLLGDYMGAVLACGDGARLSNLPAGQLMKVLPGTGAPPEVTVATTSGRRRPGITIHRVRALDPLDTSTFDRIPITTVPRVLLDVAPRLSLAELTRACHEAWIRRTTPAMIIACIKRNPGRPGVGKLRLALGSDVTLSDLEDAFLELVRAHDLPVPRTNIDHAGDKVDCHWPQLELTVELLSYRFHGSRQAFEADVARRRRSSHIAFTWGDVFERGPQTARELEAVIRAAGPARSARAGHAG